MQKKKWTMMTVLAIAGWMALPAMAALTAARDTPERSGELVAVAVASNTVIFRGAMVAVNSTGYALPAADATGLKVIGRAESTVDNSGTAGDGAKTIVVRRGVFRWTNGDTFTRADVGSLAYVEDDGQVQKAASATYDIIAGLIVDVDSDGVWVDTYTLGSQGNAAVVNIAASGNAAVTGNATVGGTLAVTGNTTIGASKVVVTAASGNIVTKGTIGAGANGTEFTVSSAGNVVAAGTAKSTGNFTVGDDKLVVTAASGNVVTKGTIGAGANGTEFTVSSAGNVGVAGTLGVTGVATFTAAPKLTAVTSAGAETATLTNAPAAGNPVAWANVSVGTNTYVVPLFAAE